MQRSRVKRFGALLVGVALVAAACGDDDNGGSDDTTAETTADDSSDESSETTDAATDEGDSDEAAAGADGCTTDGILTVGTILPVTGDLAFLGPPEVAGAELAVADINEAGGVLDGDVVLVQGDSGDTTTDTANLEVDRLLAAGADVIVGAASSAVSKTV
ncbi:MAG: ABC transporter substrate-binding protein, partial [Actinomycetota bacterium]